MQWPLIHPAQFAPPQPRLAKETLSSFLKRAYSDVTHELSCPLVSSFGQVPARLQGTYLRNGPGALGVGDQRYDHPFDGDGMIAKFSIKQGQVHYMNRFVRTRERLLEQEAGEILFRNFGTQMPGGLRQNAFNMKFKNAANTSVVFHGDKLLALWEGGWPHLIDAQTLDTKERHSFDGALKNRFSRLDRKLNPELPFSAHPRIDDSTQELFNFGLAHGTKSRLMLYRFHQDGRMLERDHVDLEGLPFIHDFGLTKRWRVFLMPPVHFKIASALTGILSPAECLQLKSNQPMNIMLVSRDDAQHNITLETDPAFIFHLVNSWEEGEDVVFIDALRMHEIPPPAFWRGLLQGQLPSYDLVSELVRYRIDLKTNKITHTILEDQFALEFPSTPCHGTRHDVAWFVGAPKTRELPYQSCVVRWDEQHTLSRDFYPHIPGEPIHVPDPEGQTQGWLLCVLYNVHTHMSELMILNAEDLEVLARLPLPHHLPPGFHGSWVGEDRLAV